MILARPWILTVPGHRPLRPPGWTKWMWLPEVPPPPVGAGLSEGCSRRTDGRGFGDKGGYAVSGFWLCSDRPGEACRRCCFGGSFLKGFRELTLNISGQ